jgi:tetratricopeptide (TPR) repeat protein
MKPNVNPSMNPNTKPDRDTVMDPGMRTHENTNQYSNVNLSVNLNTGTAENEESEHLLRSLDDLDRELAAGDINAHDYETLRADYTARAAASIREVNPAFTASFEPGKDSSEHDKQPLKGSSAERGPVTSTSSTQSARGKRSPFQRIGVAVGVLGVAIGSGVAVARFAGERVGGQGLTGTVRQAASPQQVKAQALMQIGRDNLGSDPIASLKAFDAALKIDPKLPEAMAYSGWVLRIASLSAEGKDAEELLAGAIRRIDDAILADPAYPDSYAFRGVIALREQDDPKTALAAFKKLDGLQTPPFVQQLVSSARKEAEAALAKPNSSTNSSSDSTPNSTVDSTPIETSAAQ